MRAAVSRAPGAEREVAPLELFFDLVYVFAIGQLSHHLVAHIDLRTGAETVVMALAVFSAWYMTAWGANWLDPDRLLVRALLVGLMGSRAPSRSGGATSSGPSRSASSAPRAPMTPAPSGAGARGR